MRPTLSSLRENIIDTQFNRPAVVMLSAIWTLAGVLSAAAFTVSALDVAQVQRGAAPTTVAVAQVPAMLRDSGLAISKEKLD